MHVKRAIWIVLFCCPVFAGSVVTRDGKTIDGRLTVSGTSIIVTPAAGSAVSIALSTVRRATFAEPSTRPALSASWKHLDLGKVHAAGSAGEKDGVYSLTGAGYGAWGPRDSGQFVYWPMEGDGQIIAHLVSRGDDSGGAMAGVMCRASLEPDANAAGAIVYPSGELRFNRRPMEGWMTGPEHRQGMAAPEWVRLMRGGNVFTIAKSRDGRYWQSAKATIEMPPKTLIGLFVAAATNTHAAPAAFDHVIIATGEPSATYFEGSTGPSSGVVLIDGTMLAGAPRSLSEGKVLMYPRFTPDGHPLEWLPEEKRGAAIKLHMSIPQAQVARLRFAPEPPDLLKMFPAGGTGVLLMTGDFMEGEIDRLAYSTWIDVNSVLFGAKRIEVPREVICAVIREEKPEVAAYEVSLRDGSMIVAKSVAFEGDLIAVESGLLGKLKYPIAELVAIEAGK